MGTRTLYRCCEHCSHGPVQPPDQHVNPCPNGCPAEVAQSVFRSLDERRDT
jgi:hypothetical protein